MKTVKSNLDNFDSIGRDLNITFDAVCFSLNGSIRYRAIEENAPKQPHSCVMEKGTSRWASRRYPTLSKALAPVMAQSAKDRKIFSLSSGEGGPLLVGVKTKPTWHDTKAKEFTENAILALRDFVDRRGLKHVLIPLFGTGSNLLPKAAMKKFIRENLDDRFVLCEYDPSTSLTDEDVDIAL